LQPNFAEQHQQKMGATLIKNNTLKKAAQKYFEQPSLLNQLYAESL
jgi:hypothetical protein